MQLRTKFYDQVTSLMSPTLQSEITAHTHEKWITSLHFVSQIPGTISAGRQCRSDARYDKRRQAVQVRCLVR